MQYEPMKLTDEATVVLDTNSRDVMICLDSIPFFAPLHVRRMFNGTLEQAIVVYYYLLDNNKVHMDRGSYRIMKYMDGSKSEDKNTYQVWFDDGVRNPFYLQELFDNYEERDEYVFRDRKYADQCVGTLNQIYNQQ